MANRRNDASRHRRATTMRWFFRYLELRHKGEIHRLTGHVVECRRRGERPTTTDADYHHDRPGNHIRITDLHRPGDHLRPDHRRQT